MHNPFEKHQNLKDTAERQKMVREQLEARGIDHPEVLRAMRTVPRHEFISPALRKEAYQDSALPIGHGQTISQPYIVGLMTQLAQPVAGDKVLEVGAGSGYQAAVLAEMGARVYTMEIIEYQARKAGETLGRLGYAGRIKVITGDGFAGHPEEAPFEVIVITCAVPAVPVPLLQQLKPGGRIIVPLGETLNYQTLTIVSQTPEGRWMQHPIAGVVFVPMTGPHGFPNLP